MSPTWSEEEACSQEGFPLIIYIPKDSVEERRIKGALHEREVQMSSAVVHNAPLLSGYHRLESRRCLQNLYSGKCCVEGKGVDLTWKAGTLSTSPSHVRMPGSFPRELDVPYISSACERKAC